MLALINKIFESVDDYVDSKNIKDRYTSYKSFREIESGFSSYYDKGYHSHFIEIKHNDIHFLDDIFFNTQEQKNLFENFKVFCSQLLYGHTPKQNRNQITIRYNKDSQTINDIECRWHSLGIKINISVNDMMTISVINTENDWITNPSNYSQFNINLENILNELKELMMLKVGFTFDQLNSCAFKKFMSKSIKEIINEQFIDKKYNYINKKEITNVIQKNSKNNFIYAGLVSIEQDHNETVFNIFDEIIKDKPESVVMKQLINLIMFYFKIKAENPTILFECQHYQEHINKTNNLSHIFYAYSFDNLLYLSIGENGHTYSYKTSLNDIKKISERLHDVYDYVLEKIRNDINQTLGNDDNTIKLSHIKVYEMLHI